MFQLVFGGADHVVPLAAGTFRIIGGAQTLQEGFAGGYPISHGTAQ